MNNPLMPAALPTVSEGDQDPPLRQSSLSKNERTQKEAKICRVKVKSFKYFLTLA